MDVLLGLSNEHAYFKGRAPARTRDLPHDPWFWAIPKKGEDAGAAHARVDAWWRQDPPALMTERGENKIKALGQIQDVRSFVDFGATRKAFPVYATKSFLVPEISDALFSNQDVFTAEHDVPYMERACVDLAAGNYQTADGRRPAPAWPFDTGGEKQTLRILVYDIETTQFATQRKSPPVDMVGWAEFEVAYRASKDLEREEFNFELVDEPPDWRTVEVKQEEAANVDEEIQVLLNLVRRVPNYDVVSGHNILSFDNKEVYDRIEGFLSNDRGARTLSANERRAFEEFTERWAERDRTFSFGQQSETVNFRPTSLDTYHAARRFYFFLDDFTLKRLAPFMGIEIPNRVYLSPQELKLGDPKTRRYNEHDVLEQVGVTSRLLAQSLPLAFTAGWTFEEVLTGRNVRMWDHMAMIRAARQRKIMPATCRAQGVARAVLAEAGPMPTKERIWSVAKERLKDPGNASRLREFVRVAKYGDEMPDWVELPHVIVNAKAIAAREKGDANGDDEDEEEYLGYSIPGGMTLHPQELKSHFVPWWHVVTADVGAMYPTILRALNVSADTVRLARRGETPDDWVWMYRLPEEFTKDERWVVRAPGPEEAYAQSPQGPVGVMIGIRKNPDIGVTAQAMKGVMGIATRVKKQLAAAKKDGKLSQPEVDRLAMMYASLKANRNAGTHGQMLAVNVSCRGFNLWAGGEITTVGQKILADVMQILKDKNARVVYGDTDGLYIGCSKSGKNFPEVAAALGLEYEPGPDESWYILPDEAETAIQFANDQIRNFLKYDAFELEAEHHDAMVFVVHKNYLIFDVKKGTLQMVTKGNNFRGSDKAPIAQKVLAEIMRSALRDVVTWTDEEEAREAVKAAIKKWTRETLKNFDVTIVDLADLTLVQVVQPVPSYKANPDGSPSIWMKRATALEKVTSEKLRASKKYRFVVCKNPLPGIDKPSKTGLKPLDYMWPLDHLSDRGQIDLAWYKDMIEKYVRGAFGLEDLELHSQKGLDAWM